MKKCHPEREMSEATISPVGGMGNKILFDPDRSVRERRGSLFCLAKRISVQAFFHQP